jgi:2-polyprenyl-6-methoxyphenol hydroxylase-like FAD-dependent oxidoreductase
MTSEAPWRSATVAGGGVAALTCAQRLAETGWKVRLSGPPSRPVPTLLLGAGTVELLDSIWGPLHLDGQPLRGRVVRWGAEPPVELPDRALVVDGAALQTGLEQRWGREGVEGGRLPSGPSRWVVLASGRASRSGTRRLGRRVVIHARVALRPDADVRLSRMESVDDAWLFLIPSGGSEGVLQAMVPTADGTPATVLDRALGAATDVAASVDHVKADEIAVIPAAPQATDPFTGSGRIAVGDAARAFDPLAGDGTGQGVRGAVLAAAALESIADGMEPRDALNHYSHRVQLAFLRHIAHCLRFYLDAFATSPAWAAELEALSQELRDPASRALAARPFKCRLVDRRLRPLHGPAM